jgi:hypothetical protein
VDGSWFDIVDAVRNRLPDCPVIPFADVAADELPTDDTDHVVSSSPGRSRTPPTGWCHSSPKLHCGSTR